jgi:hypothetical protein
MKGTLYYNKNLDSWHITFEEEGGTYDITVQPGRIGDLRSVGTFLESGDEVNFMIEKIDEFPYRWGVPIVVREEPKPLPTATIPTVHVKTVKKLKFSLKVSGFGRDNFEVICDNFESSDKGYYYFYIREGNVKEPVGYYPIERTIIEKIEDVQVMEEK